MFVFAFSIPWQFYAIFVKLKKSSILHFLFGETLLIPQKKIEEKLFFFFYSTVPNRTRFALFDSSKVAKLSFWNW
jgi:hypothetical protein